MRQGGPRRAKEGGAETWDSGRERGVNNRVESQAQDSAALRKTIPSWSMPRPQAENRVRVGGMAGGAVDGRVRVSRLDCI